MDLGQTVEQLSSQLKNVEQKVDNAKQQGSKSTQQGMDIREIQAMLPHRYPFLLIDRVLDYQPDDYIKAIRAVSVNDPILQGHFPDNPVVPGVLMIESMAQASAILGKLSKGEKADTCLLTEVTESRFRRIVAPGDVMQINVRLLKSRKDFFWFQGEVSVAGELAAIAKFTAKLA